MPERDLRGSWSLALGLALGLLPLFGCRSTPDRPAPSPDAPLEVRVREVPPATVLSRSYQGPYSEAQTRFEEFARYLLESGTAPAGDLMGFYLDDPGSVDPERTRYAIRIPVAPGTSASPPYEVVSVGGFQAAAVKLIGSYGEISRRYGEIYDWIAANGWLPAGPLIEVYILHPGSQVPPERYETEVLVPVEPAP